MAFLVGIVEDKSTCLALFSALVIDSTQCCASIVHLLIRLGSQPSPMRKRTNLNFLVSPIGFFQNMSCISFGHDFNGKKASPSISLVNCLPYYTTSARDSKRISPRYDLYQPYKPLSQKRRENNLSVLNQMQYSDRIGTEKYLYDLYCTDRQTV